MTLAREILAELRSMFLGDARLTAGILGVVLLAAVLLRTPAPPLVVGAMLLGGCLAVLASAILIADRRR